MSRFVTDELIAKSVTETNKYGVASPESELSEHSRIRDWKPTNSNETLELLGYSFKVMLMGVVRKPLAMYFNADDVIDRLYVITGFYYCFL